MPRHPTLPMLCVKYAHCRCLGAAHAARISKSHVSLALTFSFHQCARGLDVLFAIMEVLRYGLTWNDAFKMQAGWSSAQRVNTDWLSVSANLHSTLFLPQQLPSIHHMSCHWQNTLHRIHADMVPCNADWVSVCHAVGEQPHILHEAEVPFGQANPGASPAAAL